MKKILIIFILLIAFSLSAVGTIIFAVDSTKENVAFTENILIGDRSEAYGITVNLKSHSEYRLFWDSIYTVSETPITKTDFLFSRDQQYPTEHSDYFGVFGLDDIIALSFSEAEDLAMRGMYEKLMKDAEPDKIIQHIVYLSDILDYYPISLEINLPVYHFTYYDYDILSDKERYVVDKFKEYFRIPVLADERRSIGLRKTDSDIYLHSYGPYNAPMQGSTQWYQFQTQSTLTKDICYFTISNRKRGVDEVVLVDTSLIPGGYGIYAVPYDENGLDIDRLSTIYPLKETAAVASMGICENETQLWILTEDGGNYSLQILDLVTMTLLQTIDFEEKNIDAIYFHDGLFVVRTRNETFSDLNNTLFVQNNKGRYERIFSFPSDPSTIDPTKSDRFYRDSSWDGADMIYKDGKLLIVDKLHAVKRGELHYSDEVHYSYSSSSYDVCGFYITIYHENGVLYHAEYESSLANTLEYIYTDACYPYAVYAKWE